MGALGAGIYADADGIAEPTMPGEKMLDPDEVRNAGLFVGAIGIPFLVIALVDGVRLVDTSKVDTGDGMPEVTTSPCHDHPIAHEQLALIADGVAEWRVTSKSDQRGVIRFSVRQLPEQAFQIADGELRFTLGISESQIGPRNVQVTLPKSQAATLLAVLVNDSGSRVAIDRATAKAAHDAAIASANAALASCQLEVDHGNLIDASACWQGHSAKWELIGVASSVDVPVCIAGAKKQLDDLANCVASREKTDDEVVEKARCLGENERMAANCGPLDLRRVHADRVAQLDVAKIKTRIDARIAPIVARREQAAANEAARLARAEAADKAAQALCIGPSVVQVVLALRMGRDLEQGKMRACRYTVGFGTVRNTTRDGWMIGCHHRA